MDFDKNQLEANIIDAILARDVEAWVRGMLRYLCTFNDNVVYSEIGVARMLEQFGFHSRSAIFRAMNKLEQRLIFHKLDEYSLQLNPQFSSKSTKPFPYKGQRLIYSPAHREFLNQAENERLRQWEVRGKNKRYISEDEKMSTLLKKQSQQIDRLQQQQEQMIAMLQQLLSKTSVDADTKAEVQRHLHLVKAAENDE